MNDYSFLSLPELADRIAIARDNIRQLMERLPGKEEVGGPLTSPRAERGERVAART